MADRVASIVLLSSPHRGSSIANLVFEHIDREDHLLVKTLSSLLEIKGEVDTNAYQSGIQLTREYMSEFNKHVPDSNRVYYQSWAAIVPKGYRNPLWGSLAEILSKEEGKNDGVVSVESARWGDFKGSISSTSHAGIINLNRFDGQQAIQAEAFYTAILSDLSSRGF
jgi:triacylglycerol lipase